MCEQQCIYLLRVSDRLICCPWLQGCFWENGNEINGTLMCNHDYFWGLMTGGYMNNDRWATDCCQQCRAINAQ